MKIIVEIDHPNTFHIAACMAHVEIIERIRHVEAYNGALGAIAYAMLAGGLLSLSRQPLAERIAPRLLA